MNFNRQIHNIFKFFTSGAIGWHDFEEVGVDEPYFDWYDAEDGLYLIRDRVTEQIYFSECESPIEALKQLKDACRWDSSEDSDVSEE